jgi:hypothetical protein
MNWDTGTVSERQEQEIMRRRRTLYFDDARHYYLYVFDPPMTLEQARYPIDLVAGAGIDTFVYGVACGGMFYPSKARPMWGERSQPFQGENSGAFWSAWANLKGLIEQGLDPLEVLIDRAHEQGMEFIASLRMGLIQPQPGPGGVDGLDDRFRVSNGGRGLAEPKVRAQLAAILKEVACDYPTDGIELDFAAAPGGVEIILPPREARQSIPMMTEFVREIVRMARERAGKPAVVGARVYPTEPMNLDAGLDVRAWLKEGLLDYVTPLFYATMLLDPDMPIDWLVEAGHESDVSVYGFLQPFFRDETRLYYPQKHASLEMIRAAAANFTDRGADGLYAWFLPWPLGPKERGLLTELADPRKLKRSDKHYCLRRRDEAASAAGYDAALPLAIPRAESGRRYSIPFYISDDDDDMRSPRCQVLLRLNIFDLVTADKLTLLLNGETLAEESCRRYSSSSHVPYYGRVLEFDLQTILPRKGRNLLEISLDQRPLELEAGIRIDDVEVIVRYGLFPSGLESERA